MIVTQDGLLGLGVENDDFLDLVGELAHVFGELANLCTLSSDTFAADLLGSLPIAIEDVVALLVALELTAPETTEVEVSLAIIINKTGRVDTETALDGFRVWDERSLGLVANSDTNAENVLLVASREVEVVFPVLGSAVRRPQLLGDPRNVLGPEDDAVVCHFAGRRKAVDTEDMVVGHIILVAIVIELDVGLAIVRRVDVDLAIENMSRGVGGVSGGDEGCHVDGLLATMN